jgi:hypothetical protein
MRGLEVPSAILASLEVVLLVLPLSLLLLGILLRQILNRVGRLRVCGRANLLASTNAVAMILFFY